MPKLTDEEAKKKLTPEQYDVLVNKATEAPFSGKFLDHNDEGMYTCAFCGANLFSSSAKYDSKTPGLIGWPSFSEVAETGSVKFVEDNTLGSKRTEVVCANCGGHLGHVFDADDSSTGKHYCINSCALDFNRQEKS